jgi:NAD+ synthase
MNRVANYKKLKLDIVDWIGQYVLQNPSIKSLVVGVSGGIDSAVVSTLCAETGLPTYVLSMPLYSSHDNDRLSDDHTKALEAKYSNVTRIRVELSGLYDKFVHSLNWWTDSNQYTSNQLANANTKSRLRMVTLYQVAGSVNGIVVGTGNKVEDYGVGFYTKYGDGGVDIAPIADLYKTEVWELGKELGVDQRIIDAPPTDGLWTDGRSDEDQIGTSYEMLEWVMEKGLSEDPMFMNEQETLAINVYQKFNKQNKHKMLPIPTFKL